MEHNHDVMAKQVDAPLECLRIGGQTWGYAKRSTRVKLLSGVNQPIGYCCCFMLKTCLCRYENDRIWRRPSSN